jgi:hypothetical protein
MLFVSDLSDIFLFVTTETKLYQINNDNNKTPQKMFYFSLLEYQIRKRKSADAKHSKAKG